MSRKRKKKNWEDEDYYDSDDDTFLDRTGTVEKKRQDRMKKAGKIEERPETYESLVKKKSAAVLYMTAKNVFSMMLCHTDIILRIHRVGLVSTTAIAGPWSYNMMMAVKVKGSVITVHPVGDVNVSWQPIQSFS